MTLRLAPKPQPAPRRTHIYPLVQGPPEVRLRTWRPTPTEWLEAPPVWFVALVYFVVAVLGLAIGWGIFRGVEAAMKGVGL